MTLTVPPEDVRTWRQIRDVSFQVVLLTRRECGLWALPVNIHDRYAYARPGSVHARGREQARFGYPSITVTCNALMALGAAGAPVPSWLVNGVLQQIDEAQHPRGGYGSPKPDKDGALEPVPTPRHTAMAAVTQMLFPLNRS